MEVITLVRKIKFKKKSNYNNIDPGIIPVEEYDLLEKNIVDMMTYNTFLDNGMVRLKETIDEKIMLEVPIFKTINDYLEILKKEGEIRLTKIGNLPPKYVKELYHNNEIKEGLIEDGISTLRNEWDSEGVVVARVIAEICKFTKIRKNTLSLTVIGKKIMEDKRAFFREVMITFTNGYNWAYLDGYDELLRLGEIASYTYYLINKYGNTLRDTTFYSEKIVLAFPMVLLPLETKNNYTQTREDQFNSIYSLRTFKRYMEFLGIVKLSSEGFDKKIIKKQLFDKIIDLTPINRMKDLNLKERKKDGIEGLISYLNPNQLSKLKFDKDE